MTAQLPEGTLHVFATLCGAAVAMVTAGLLPKSDPHHRDVPGFTWHCLGCGDHAGYPRDRAYTRDMANTHAGACRSVPLPDPVKRSSPSSPTCTCPGAHPLIPPATG